MVDAGVLGDAVDPGVERGVALEPVQISVDPDEGLLDEVHRVFPVAHDAVADVEHATLIALDELLKGATVTITCQGDEFLIGVFLHRSGARRLGATESTRCYRPV